MEQPLKWTPEQVDTLKQYAGKMSSKQIGALIGRSKNAVKNKLAAMDLSRFAVETKPKVIKKRIRKPKPKPVKVAPAPAPEKPPMVSRFKNHEAEARKSLPHHDGPSKIEWCPQCYSPVSNWAEHFERLGHRRT